MKRLVLLVLVLSILGCTHNEEMVETTGPMTGDKVNVQAEAYNKMCQREPESPLCKKE